MYTSHTIGYFHLIHIDPSCVFTEGSFINYIMVFVSMLLDLNCLYTQLVLKWTKWMVVFDVFYTPSLWCFGFLIF
jgi:hypothetical protein